MHVYLIQQYPWITSRVDNPPDFLLDVWNSPICDPSPKSVLSTLEKYELFTQVQSLTAISLFIIPQRHLLSGLFRYCTFQILFQNVYVMYCFSWVTMATRCLYIVYTSFRFSTNLTEMFFCVKQLLLLTPFAN